MLPLIFRRPDALVGAALLAAALVLIAPAARADTVTLGALKDTTVFQNNVNNSSGGSPGLFAGTNGMTSPRRALIQFDIAAALPAGAIITDVQFRLVLGQIAGNAAQATRTISLFGVSADWGEGTLGTSNSLGGTGQGSPAAAGDATWNARMFGSTLWNTPGGDFNPTARATLTLTNATVGTAFTWTSTGLVNDVQTWLNTPAANHGWELINADETVAQTLLGFYSREGTGAAGSAAALPQLTVSFVPEPGPATCLFAVALAGIVWHRAARRPAARC